MGFLDFFKMLLNLTLYFCVYTLPTEGPHEHRLPSQLPPPTPEGPRKPPRGAFTGLWSGLWLDILSSLQPFIPGISTPLPPGLRSLTARAKMFSVSKQTTQSEAKRAWFKGPQPSVTQPVAARCRLGLPSSQTVGRTRSDLAGTARRSRGSWPQQGG